MLRQGEQKEGRLGKMEKELGLGKDENPAGGGGGEGGGAGAPEVRSLRVRAGAAGGSAVLDLRVTAPRRVGAVRGGVGVRRPGGRADGGVQRAVFRAPRGDLADRRDRAGPDPRAAAARPGAL